MNARNGRLRRHSDASQVSVDIASFPSPPPTLLRKVPSLTTLVSRTDSIENSKDLFGRSTSANNGMHYGNASAHVNDIEPLETVHESRVGITIADNVEPTGQPDDDDLYYDSDDSLYDIRGVGTTSRPPKSNVANGSVGDAGSRMSSSPPRLSPKASMTFGPGQSQPTPKTQLSPRQAAQPLYATDAGQRPKPERLSSLSSFPTARVIAKQTASPSGTVRFAEDTHDDVSATFGLAPPISMRSERIVSSPVEPRNSIRRAHAQAPNSRLAVHPSHERDSSRGSDGTIPDMRPPANYEDRGGSPSVNTHPSIGTHRYAHAFDDGYEAPQQRYPASVGYETQRQQRSLASHGDQAGPQERSFAYNRSYGSSRTRYGTGDESEPHPMLSRNDSQSTETDVRRLKIAMREELARTTNLAEWAPRGQGPIDKSTIPNLPDLSKVDDGAPTANPITLIQRDLDFSARRLLNEKVFEDLLKDPLGRHRFREYLARFDDTAELDLWMDAAVFNKLVEEVKDTSQALHDVYMANGAPNQVRLPMEFHQEALGSLRKLASIDSAFTDTQRYLLDSMYNHQFQRFVMSKLVEQAKVKLGKFNLTESEREGLGDCFCLTNPRLRDHPIVLVSDGFTAVTGYPRQQIVGRNCRFLQGPGTAPESVQRIREGLNSGEGCTELLLNYRRDGQPFYCLLNIIPLRDATGTLVYFVGGQVNVTGVLASSTNLSFLISGDPSENTLSPPSGSSSHTHSPTLMAYRKNMNLSSGNLSSNGSVTGSGPRAAAGSVNPITQGRFDGPVPTSNVNLSPPRTQRWRGFGGLFGSKVHSEPGNFGVQKLLGAEGVLGGDAKPLEDQLSYFQDTYSKLIVFKRSKREVIFCTPQLLAFFGLPFSTPSELFTSPLIHSDLLDFVTAGEKSETKKLRAQLKHTIKTGGSLSIMCGMKFMGRNKYFGKNEYLRHKFGILHLTPLKDRDGDSVAYVGVLG